MRKTLPVSHPLYHPNDRDGYIRFLSALSFDDRKKETRKYFKYMLFGDEPYSSRDYQNDLDLRMKLGESVSDGSFIEKYLMNREMFLSERAIRKFFRK